MTLRGFFVVMTAAVTALAVSLAVTLVVLTTSLLDTSHAMALAVGNVRMAEEAQIDLLLHGRVSDHLVKRSIEDDLQRKLSEARSQAVTPDVQRLAATAQSQVDAYLSASREAQKTESSQEAAYAALGNLVNVNAVLARRAQARSEAWNHVANVVGIGAAVVFPLLAALLLWWVRRRVSHPLFRLAQTMDRFGRGERTVRAVEEGPAELREMTSRFNEMATALDIERAAQTAFLGGVAHDLRNPVSALLLAVRTLPDNEPLPAESRIRNILRLIDRQLTRLDRMIGDFLDTARMEAGELELRCETRDVRPLVRDVCALFDEISPAHRLRVRVPDEPVFLSCDPIRLEQVLANLLSNALKYSPYGGNVTVSVIRDEGSAVISVSDEGVGIGREDQRRLFEPFRRVGLSKETIPGVGLGLFVARRIVEAHGGAIEVESQRGHGATFRVRLPGALKPMVSGGLSSHAN